MQNIGLIRQQPKSALHHRYIPFHRPRLFLYTDNFKLGVSNVLELKIVCNASKSSGLTGR